MRGVNHVILAGFVAAMHQSTDTPRLLAAAQRDSKLAKRCVRAITVLCLMTRYRSPTRETNGYMNDYLVQFLQCLHIFGEFRGSKGDRQEAARAIEGLREGQARQSTIDQYLKLKPPIKQNEVWKNNKRDSR